MNASKPLINHKRAEFLILLAFSLEQSLISMIEDAASPKSVTKTKGTNQKETSCKIKGVGLNKTAEI